MNLIPISLLSVFNRIFEKTMYRRLKSFLEKNGILHDSLYGFREKKIEPAILDIAAHQKESNSDRKLYTWSIFFDPQKAFESVDYLILLKKFNYYGIKESLTTGSLHI